MNPPSLQVPAPHPPPHGYHLMGCPQGHGGRSRALLLTVVRGEHGNASSKFFFSRQNVIK